MFGEVVLALIFWAFFGELLIAIILGIFTFITNAVKLLWKPVMILGAISVFIIIAKSSGQ